MKPTLASVHCGWQQARLVQIFDLIRGLAPSTKSRVWGRAPNVAQRLHSVPWLDLRAAWNKHPLPQPARIAFASNLMRGANRSYFAPRFSIVSPFD